MKPQKMSQPVRECLADQQDSHLDEIATFKLPVTYAQRCPGILCFVLAAIMRFLACTIVLNSILVVLLASAYSSSTTI